ncbi:MAG: hypothetical protein AAF902_13990 [Chloroflexota bacterium]
MKKISHALSLPTAIVLVVLLSACNLVTEGNNPVATVSPTPQSLYNNETIRLIVPFGAGGGTDTWARTIAPFMQKHLGGNVQVQVINKPGASGVSGTNSFAFTHDEKTILVSSGSIFFPYLLGDNSVEYDFNEFVPIIGSPLGGVIFVSPDTGIESAADLCAFGDSLTYGGISSTGLDIVPLLTFELLNIDVRAIFGYDGKGASRIAFEEGETNIEYQTTPGYLANVDRLTNAGAIVPLYTFGILDSEGNIIRDPVFPELPTIKEVYNICFGGDPSGVEWDVYQATLTASFAIQKMMWVHGDTQEEAITALRAAASATADDPEFQETAENLIGNYDFFVGHEAQVTFAAASSLSPESISWLKDLLTEKYGARY